MTQGLTPPERPSRFINRRLSLLIFLAKLFIYWERLCPRLLPAFILLSSYMIAVLMGVFSALPHGLHLLCLVGTLLSIGYLLWTRLQDLSFPTIHDAMMRLERDSPVEGQPLLSLNDQLPAGQSDSANVLWHRHLQRQEQQLSNIELSLPFSNMAKHDPFGLRVLMMLLILIASVVSGDGIKDKVIAGFLPYHDEKSASLHVDLWLTPPPYTGVLPSHFSVDIQGALKAKQLTENPSLIPVGTTFFAQVSELGDDISIQLDGQELPFVQDRIEYSFVVGDVVGSTSLLSIFENGEVKNQWPVMVVADLPPIIRFSEGPQKQSKGHLIFEYKALDDFGLRAAEIMILPDTSTKSSIPYDTLASLEGAVVINMPIKERRDGDATSQFYGDVSDHPLAGEVVTLQLQATDNLGQVGQSSFLMTSLPERQFQNAYAQQLISIRKQLYRLAESAKRSDELPVALKRLSSKYKKAKGNFSNFLAMNVAAMRIHFLQNMQDVQSVASLLWRTAISLEDGALSSVKQMLSKAQQNVTHALLSGSGPHELEGVFEQLKQAIDQYLKALQAQNNNQDFSKLMFQLSNLGIDLEDMTKRVQDIQNLTEVGALGEARRSMDELTKMLSALNDLHSDEAKTGLDFKAAAKILDALGALSRDQQSLLDDTFSQFRQGQGVSQEAVGPRQRGSASLKQTKQQQETQDQTEAINQGYKQGELAEALKETMATIPDLLGSIPPALDGALKAMTQAQGGLRDEDFRRAMPYQAYALDHLRQGREDIAAMIAQKVQGVTAGTKGQQQGGSTTMMPAAGSGGVARDPFGRSGGGGLGSQIDSRTIKIPTQLDILRVRKIYEEILERSGDHEKSIREREYLQRLLRQF